MLLARAAIAPSASRGVTLAGAPTASTALASVTARRWATKKSGGSRARQNRRPVGKRLGLKKYDGEYVETGHIIVRQRGTKNHAGRNVALGRDHTLYALMPGYVHFTHDPVRDRTFINVLERKAGDSQEDSVDGDTASLTGRTFDTAFRSKLSGGWRNDEIFTRVSVPTADGAGETGAATTRRVFSLYDLKRLSPATDRTDRSAVDFDAVAAHLRALNLGGSERVVISAEEHAASLGTTVTASTEKH